MDDKVARENVVVDARDVDLKQTSLDQEQSKKKHFQNSIASTHFLTLFINISN